MDGPNPGERQLVPDWSYRLVVLSFCISWLGAYTSTQIVIHAKYSRVQAVKYLWTFLASVTFGFTAIWCMHFVGMLACGLDVRITFNIILTILSAAVAIVFTFAAFSTSYASQSESSLPGLLFPNWGKSIRAAFMSFRGPNTLRDPEAGHNQSESADEERRPILSNTSDRGDDGEENDETARAVDGPEWQRPSDELHRTSTDSSDVFVGPPALSSNTTPLPQDESTPRNHHPVLSHSALPSPGIDHDISSSSRTSEESTPLTTDSSDESLFASRRLSSSSHNTQLSGTTLSTRSWSAPLHAGLSREARMRIKAHARDRPAPHFGWRYWMKAYYSSITLFLAVRAAIWGLAIVFMHYCGMWAMEIPEGRIAWDWGKVTLSYIVAFAVCFVGCIAMVHMEVNFGRQVAFSTIAAIGCCSMHYTGIWAATFYTKAPPSDHPGYPDFLPFVIIVIAVFVCVISNAVLAHNAILSRNQMAEVILTRRRIWRIMAEKEAAEQANELKQQFISVASHEIRTPLHAVNGYCELLAMTNLTDEQKLYVTSIQQACHAINVIAGNVLDFSKLDRNNVELSARPVLVDLRKMVEDQARIIETKGTVHPQPAVDIIVSVADNVPSSMYLDETYTFRILMNLLSNAQKFCEEGYVCATVSMDNDNQVVITISDTGCGIPKSFRNSLFQPFSQADSSSTRPKQGTGLGLSIVKHLVQRMSGTVEVKSVEGVGSTFTVKLPITVPTNTPPRPIAQLALKKRIKVVYRHARTAQLYVDLWNRHGMIATLATTETPLSELIRDADAVWSDIKSIQQSQGLRQLMAADASTKMPPLFVVHADAHELASLESALSVAKTVILVKRPVILNTLVDILQNPEPHMGSHITTQSRVRFALPEVETPMDERQDIFLPDSAQVMTHGGDKILLVEDNMVNQHLGKRLLEKLGYDVVTASNGEEAVEKVVHNTFRCCFMDCQMPVLDGFGATAKIRELENNGTIHGRLPIIALTANVSPESEEKCRSAGMDHLLVEEYCIRFYAPFVIPFKDSLLV